jgi:PKD domain
MPRYRARILAPLLATAALAVPATASATTFCVNARNCPAGGVQAGGDLQGALDAAAARSGDDTVLVGDKGSPYVGPFTYEGATNRGVTNPVTITADAGGRPVLTAGVGLTVLTLDQATVEGVDVAMPSAAEGTGVLTTDATLRDVTVSSPQNGPGATGIQDLGATVLDHVRVTVSGDVGLQVGAPGKVSIRRVSVSAQNLDISNADGAVAVEQAGALSATQSQLTGTTTGLFAAASTDLDRVVVATSAPSSTGISANDANLRLTHVTVAHEGPEGGTDTALSLHAAAANPSLTFADSTLAGYTHGIVRTVSAAHTLAITAENNVWNPAGDQLGGASAGAVRELGDVHLEPALVNLAAGDLRPRGSSPQIDLDTTTDATTYTDLVGTPTVDGNGDGTAQPDAGALEYRRQAPTIDAIAIPTAGTAGTPVAFDTSVSDADGDQVQVRWDFGDGANAAGPASSHTYAAPGSFQGTLTATDEAGLTARRTFTVNVTPGARTGNTPGAPTGNTPGAPTGNTPGAPTGTPAGGHPPAPRVRLVLDRLRLSPSRISVRRAGNLRLRFRASGTATIRIVPSRRIARHAVPARALVRRVGAGNESIALASALRTLRLLKPGRLTLTITASDARGDHTRPRTLQLTLVR